MITACFTETEHSRVSELTPGKVWKLREHIARLYRSAHTLLFELPITQEEMTQVILKALRTNEITDGYIRVTVSRGVGLGLDPRVCKRGNCCRDDTELADIQGTCTNAALRWSLAYACAAFAAHGAQDKSAGKYVCNIQAKLEANRVGAGEGLMLNIEGYVAEATGDNIFLMKNGVLITPPTYAGILEGITRNAVIDIARSMDSPVAETLFTQYDVYTADECFLTGTAAEVIPVVKTDNRTIGTGRPGNVTKRLIEAFQNLTATRAFRLS